MTIQAARLAIVLTLMAPQLSLGDEASDGWVSLFNGKDMSGWKIAENPDTFSVKDGVMIAHGPRAMAYYAGDVEGADFEDFEFKCEVLTKPKANSGMYFHTAYVDEGWPTQGHEVQINQTHPDPRKTGGLYAVKDVMNESPVKDNEWFTQHVIVRGKHVVVKVNGQVTCDYTEPDNYTPPKDRPGRMISHGTFALQGHDPESEIHFRSVMVRPLE